jgi:6-pyruvoyltetrahydropterin/6-carboxytetrahydropterin synthase
MFEVRVEHTFAAAHALRDYHGSCENLHGHNFRVEISVEGERLDQTGMLVDFLELKKQINAAVMRLDHQNLNEVAPFDTLNPSAENIAQYLHQEIGKALPSAVTVSEVRVWETNEASAVYRLK